MQNSRQKFFFAVFFALLLVSTGFIPISDSFAQQDMEKPFTGYLIKPKEATSFQLTATIMEVGNKDPRYVVVGEKIILVTSYKMEDEIKSTKLLNPYGSAITLDQLKKGDRVVVQGLKLEDNRLIGTTIQIKSKKK